MTETIQFEAKKHRYVQAAGGMTVTFIIHPNDPVPPELAAAALGTVFMVRLQQTDSGHWIDEQASAHGDHREVETAAQQSGEELLHPPKGDPLLVKRAALLCKNSRFQKWLVECGLSLNPKEEEAIAAVRAQCDVKSRSLIGANSYSRERFLEMETAFWQEMATQDHGELIR